MAGARTPDVVVSGAAGGLARRIRHAAIQVLRGERRQARVSVTVVGRARMQRINAAYLRHADVTDVISFALPQPDGSTVADVYLCRWAAAQSARTHGVPVREEVLRLVVHGTLHILGWDHPAGDARFHSPMWRAQERYMRSLA